MKPCSGEEGALNSSDHDASQNSTTMKTVPRTGGDSNGRGVSAATKMGEQFGVLGKNLWYDEVYGFIPRDVKQRWDKAESASTESRSGDDEHEVTRQGTNFPIRSMHRASD